MRIISQFMTWIEADKEPLDDQNNSHPLFEKDSDEREQTYDDVYIMPWILVTAQLVVDGKFMSEKKAIFIYDENNGEKFDVFLFLLQLRSSKANYHSNKEILI